MQISLFVAKGRDINKLKLEKMNLLQNSGCWCTATSGGVLLRTLGDSLGKLLKVKCASKIATFARPFSKSASTQSWEALVLLF